MSEQAPPPRPTAAGVLEAARRLAGHLRPTPLEPSNSLSGGRGGDVYLKLECLQRTGSFKVRGALNAIAALGEEARSRGVVTASAGNHGLGVALAGRAHGVRATVFVPADAPLTKRRRIAGYGAELRLTPGDYDAAHAEAEAHAARTGAVYVHAFSDPRVVEGQGTVGLEVLAELPATGTLLVPVGGGGLIGGMGLIARALSPRVRVVGVQSTATPAMHASLAAGALRSPAMGATLCDGLSGDIDQRSLALAREVVDEMVLVEEREVRTAIRRLYEEEGMVAEGSGVVAVAALYADLVPSVPHPLVAVVTGGNIDAPRLAEILSGAPQ